MFDLPPSLQSRRLDLLPVGDVLTADVMENLQPPPEDAASDPDAYYRHLAEMFQRFEADVSVGGIAAAQATADRLWRVLHPLKRPRRKATVGDRVAAARRMKESHPPPADAAAAPPKETRTRAELVQFILAELNAADRRRRADAAASVAAEGATPAATGSAPAPAAAFSEAAEAPAADIIAAAAAPVGSDPELPASPQQVWAPPRGATEPDWTPDVRDALRPFPCGEGEELRRYLGVFKCHAVLLKPRTLQEWQNVKRGVDREHAEGEAYRRELARNSGKHDARRAYEAAAARGDPNAIWFE